MLGPLDEIAAFVVMRNQNPSRSWRAAIGSLVCFCAVWAWAQPAAAEIKVKTLPNGKSLIYNESTKQRARRTSTQLIAVPDAEMAKQIEYYARRQSLSPRLVQAVVQVESGYNPLARSVKGAMGLMQLMPPTAAELGVSAAYEIDQNLRGGTLYLRRMLDRFGSLELALAAYNAGPHRVEQYSGIPPFAETRRYVDKVMSLYRGRPAPADVRAEAKYGSWRRERDRVREARLDQPAGREVFITRDANNRIVITTDPQR